KCASELARNGKISLIFDLDGKFTPLQLKKLVGPEFETISNRIFVHAPKDFRKFTEIVEDLENYVSRDVCLLIFDTITACYRPEKDNQKKNFKLGKKFNQILAQIQFLSESRDLIVIWCNQVRAGMDENENIMVPRANKLVKYWSSFDLWIQVPDKKSPRRKILLLNKENKPVKKCEFLLFEENFNDY
ncbi:MAG: P-loop NTPase family protein, partial [Candidatus Helarchaeales archaeon]